MRTIYAIRDRVANDLVGYYPLTTFRTDAQAVRYFADSIAMEKSALGAHPNDYELIACGEVDDDGEIIGFNTPKIIITGTAIVAMSNTHGDDDADVATGRTR